MICSVCILTSGYLNSALMCWDYYTLASCGGDPNDYIKKFGESLREIQNFQGKVTMDDNVLIWRFHANLGPDYASYVERYAQEHDPFDNAGKVKYNLSHAMNRFQNTVHMADTSGAIVLLTTARPTGSPIRVES